MDTIRILQVFAAHGVIVFIYLLLSYFLLKNRRSRTKTIFACFYLFTSLGFILNWIYFFIYDEQIVLILYYIAIISTYGAGIFLAVFALTFWKGEDKITLSRQITIVIISYAFCSFSVFIPNGVTINASTDWSPIWSIELTLYFFVIILIFEVIPSIYFIIRKIKSIDPSEKNIRKGWRVFLFGFMLYAFAGSELIITRIYFTGIIAFIAVITFIIFISTGPILMYYGLRHEFNI